MLPRLRRLPASTMIPRVQVRLTTTVRVGSNTPRRERKLTNRITTMRNRVNGTKRVKSSRIDFARWVLK